MSQKKQIKKALISVFNKENLDKIVKTLDKLNVEIFSTGGTQKYIEEQGSAVSRVEDLTSYPSILGGRVKTLHPKVFGGILSRRDLDSDVAQLDEFQIPEIDLVIVDLYPFEDTVASGASHEDIIEKIDIGGISLIRAAAKNYKDVVIVSSKNQYNDLLEVLAKQEGETTIEERKQFATAAFNVSSHYDTQIFNYFNNDDDSVLKESILDSTVLRYGENPHQKGIFYGNLSELFDKLHGKELSYNNLLDVDAAVSLMQEFKNAGPTFAILKHNNACGIANRNTVKEAYLAALAGDPVSAFGGILITNKTIELDAAEEINKLFCEVVIAPEFSNEALTLLKSKKNRILLIQKEIEFPKTQIRTLLNGILYQEKDNITDKIEDFKNATELSPSENQMTDLEFASKISKHTKSNTIVLAKNKQLLASGTGQTSRVDALNQAIHKAKSFSFDLQDAVMASDAFFPFPDCVEIAGKEGINAVIQPGGSIKDQLSIDYCNQNKISMVFTGTRHFKH
jgi:phosphoribosylaminoimidazolecarboxamide formyltransferase/IMP cyclohydrolase